MSPKPKPGHKQTFGGNLVPETTIEKLKDIADKDSRSQAKELEWLIEQRYAELAKVKIEGDK